MCDTKIVLQMLKTHIQNNQMLTLSRTSPGALSRVEPNNKKSFGDWTTDKRQWPPDISNTRKGKPTCTNK